jgi:hypothetical protein
VDSFVVLTWPPSPVNKALRDLLEVNLDDEGSFEEVCSVELLADGQFAIFPCGEGDALPIDAANMIEPDRFADLRAGREMLILLGSTVMSIDIESGSGPKSSRFQFPLTMRPRRGSPVDGSRLIYLDSARVNVLHLGTGLSTFVESTGGNRPGFPSIIYADNEVRLREGCQVDVQDRVAG